MTNPYKLNLSRFSTHNLILNQIGGNKIVLDVGCNNGYLGRISDSPNIFYGIDNNKKKHRRSKVDL